ncbi:carbohydrate porin [Nostoc sp. 3335mG]|nr:carbohydrate porin [Nostoc sp. 3335mG]
MQGGRFRAGWRQVYALLLALMAPAARAETPPLMIHYLGDIIADASGGRDTGARWISRLDVAYATSDRLFGIDGAHAQADIMLLRGGGFSAVHAGDYQVVDNIDAPHAIRPYEVWLEIPFGPRIRAKAGLVDLNNEFDEQYAGALFLNSSFGIGPDLSQSGPNGPSIFPITAPGLVVAYQPPGWTAKIGLFDARAGDVARPHAFWPDSFGADGALVIGEAHRQIGPLIVVQGGAWAYTSGQPRLDGSGTGTSAGGYAMIEARLIGHQDGHALRVWLRGGGASDRTEPILAYLGGGFTWGDDRAAYGLAFAHARLGDPAYRIPIEGRLPDRAETAIEATARWRLATGVAIQPDVQYVVHPGWDRANRNALVLALRLDVTKLVGL